MSWKVGGGVTMAIVAAVLVLTVTGPLGGGAQGVPSGPTAQLSGVLNPSQSQSFQLTITSQVMSLEAPNSIWGLGQYVVVSVIESNANGGTTTVIQNQRYALAILNSTGSTYTLGVTIAVSSVAVCSTTGCGSGAVTNLTVLARAQVVTIYSTWFSAQSTIRFSNLAQYQSVPPALPPSPYSFYWELFGPLTLAATFAFLGAMIAWSPKPELWAGLITTIVLSVIEYVVLFGR